MELVYLTGDATEPKKKPAIIAHCCNNIGGWGAGFVLALSKKSKLPELSYRQWHKKGLSLGDIQICDFAKDIYVANMIAQRGIRSTANLMPLDYEALKTCFEKVYRACFEKKMTLHMPRIGCGLAGGNWKKVEGIIKECMKVDTYIYDFQKVDDGKKE